MVMSSVQGGFAMTGAFAACLLSHAPFAYAALAVWRYFLVAHQRYFGIFSLQINGLQGMLPSPPIFAKVCCYENSSKPFCFLVL
jgi:hypothetical protein